MSERLAVLYPDHIQTLCQRHDSALANSGFDRVVIHSGAPRYLYMDDMAHAFRPNPPFKAWLPLVAHPHCLVVYEGGQRPKLVYYQPTDYWHSVPAAPSGYWVEHFDVHVIDHPDAARPFLDGGGHTAWLGELCDGVLAQGFEANPVRLVSELDFARAVKTPYERECMRRASRLGARAHEAARQAFFDGKSEFDIHLAYCAACGQTETQLPYANIVALNENAATLHYTALQRQAPPKTSRHSFLIDAGASFSGYASDITRSYSFADEKFAELIDALDKAQLTLCNLVVPGRPYPDIHDAAHAAVGAILASHGLVTCSAQAAVEQGLTRLFFPHGIGHFIGLQVHDVGGHQKNPAGDAAPPADEHPFLRLTRTLEAGHVVTIEPGIYIIEQLLKPVRNTAAGRDIGWNAVEALRPFGGVRIEDDVVAALDAPENLTRNAFAAL